MEKCAWKINGHWIVPFLKGVVASFQILYVLSFIFSKNWKQGIIEGILQKIRITEEKPINYLVNAQ